ncbi:WAS/WASL-interacting protein family member 3-like [Microtus oregoni]|uniref:WAS/WASL-interacting protein family member 3-like n=1 Tax=Microtus oregoni TaxID=111838 RepID=UPI001BB11B38|nr:WAS/WASL-interacting protein family member 3-like [Microtus oregoni]
MEVLDEYDNEFPQSVTFCQLISEEDFERQAATYTERSLRCLFRSLDRNPALAERVVRKGKQTEMEQRGLLSGLWAKFVCAVQGELNQCNSMGALEMHQRLEQLKWRIHRVHLYSRGAKKRRRRRRLKPKRAADPVIFRDRSTSPCLPPAPLPPPLPPPPLPVTTMASVVAASPPVYTMPRVFGPFPPLSGKPMEKLDISRSEVKLNWNSLSSTSKSHMIDLTPLVLNPGGFHFSYLAGNNAHKLHCPGFPCVASCSEPSSTNETPSPVVKASIFTPPVLLKFQPPVPRPKEDSENDPGSAESIPAKKSE